MDIKLTPLAFVKNSRIEAYDDFWKEVISEIELAEHVPTEAFLNITDFSHLEIIFFFDQADPKAAVYSYVPRNNPAYPTMGIFAQRKKDRPNALGLTTVELIKLEGRIITVRNIDAINGTPILDIKPVFKEFQPKGEIKQPEWVADLMKNYFA